MRRILILAALALSVIGMAAAPVPDAKPEDVGLSSERLALIDRMIDRLEKLHLSSWDQLSQ